MKLKIYILMMLCCLSVGAAAESKWDYMVQRNELRIGWGDQLFETLMWKKPVKIVNTLPTSYEQVYNEDFTYYQHLWIEYQWRFTSWFSLGGMVDGSGVSWSEVTRNGQGQEIARDGGHHFYNIVVMPTIRFTYFHHPNVNLYSGLGLGIDVNGGSETDVKGRHTAVGAAVQVTLFGVSANYDRWFWTVDFGGLTALKSTNVIYMASSRIINVGFGARF